MLSILWYYNRSVSIDFAVGPAVASVISTLPCYQNIVSIAILEASQRVDLVTTSW